MEVDLLWQEFSVSKDDRAIMKGQRAQCIWLTGLSAAGKSTIANRLDSKLFARRKHAYVLDGDNIRHGLNRDLSFSVADRSENIRRVAEVARIIVDAGLISIVSFISPFRAERQYARSLFKPGEFIEVYVATPFAECERRDPKGLYGRARRGDIKDFTGIDSAYEEPEDSEIVVSTFGATPDECADRILMAIDI